MTIVKLSTDLNNSTMPQNLTGSINTIPVLSGDIEEPTSLGVGILYNTFLPTTQLQNVASNLINELFAPISDEEILALFEDGETNE